MLKFKKMEIKVFKILYSKQNGMVEAEHKVQEWMQITIQGTIAKGWIYKKIGV